MEGIYPSPAIVQTVDSEHTEAGADWSYNSLAIVPTMDSEHTEVGGIWQYDHEAGAKSEGISSSKTVDSGGIPMPAQNIQLQQISSGQYLPYQCDFCHFSSGRKQDLARHQKERHGPPLTCPYCNDVTTRRERRLAEHIRDNHPSFLLNKTKKSVFRRSSSGTDWGSNDFEQGRIEKRKVETQSQAVERQTTNKHISATSETSAGLVFGTDLVTPRWTSLPYTPGWPLARLPPRTIDTKIDPHLSPSATRFRRLFKVDWNPKKFMDTQFGSFDLADSASIGSVIVLCGTSKKAQATTCKEYLQLHWPDTYMEVLQCLEKVYNQESAHRQHQALDPAGPTSRRPLAPESEGDYCGRPLNEAAEAPQRRERHPREREPSPRREWERERERRGSLYDDVNSEGWEDVELPRRVIAGRSIRTLSGSNLELVSWLDGDQLKFVVTGREDQILEIGQQLAWLGAALQHSSSESLESLEAKSERRNPSSGDLVISFKRSPLSQDEASCWQSLFNKSVIATGFPIAERGEEEGLEISLEMMTALTGVRHAVEYNGGVILKGHSSAFVPVKRYKDSIQWHYITKEDNKRLSYQEVEARCLGRALLDQVDLESVISTREFVGWWGSTVTHLGTEDASYENIDWSSSFLVAKHLKISGATLGFQQFVTGELNFCLGQRDCKLHIKRDGPYHDIVQCASRTPVVLFDCEDKRAWLVPASAVILHMAKTKHDRDAYMNEGNQLKFPTVDVSKSNHRAAEEVLRANFAFKICSHNQAGSRYYYLHELVRDLWSHLQTLLDARIKKEESPGLEIRSKTQERLRGWEFMDLVAGRSPFRLKETSIEKTHGGWVQLANDIDAIILFGTGFGDIIQPAELSSWGLCHTWKTVPKWKDYLAAGIPMLKLLLEEAGSKLTRKYLTSTHLRWHQEGLLWQDCDSMGSFSCGCNRLQQVIPERTALFGEIKTPVGLRDDGAVIFGSSGSPIMSLLKPKRKPQPRNGLYNQPNVDLLSNGAFDSSTLTTPLQKTEFSSPKAPSLNVLKPAGEQEKDADVDEMARRPDSLELVDVPSVSSVASGQIEGLYPLEALVNVVCPRNAMIPEDSTQQKEWNRPMDTHQEPLKCQDFCEFIQPVERCDKSRGIAVGKETNHTFGRTLHRKRKFER